MIESNTTEAAADALAPGLSGDPMLKRLVSLSTLGWRARFIVLSNGVAISGTLISPSDYRAALSASVRQGASADKRFEELDLIVAESILADDADEVPLGVPADVPEPRYLHLAEVEIGSIEVPFLRLRLPAVSGFWLTTLSAPGTAEPTSEGR